MVLLPFVGPLPHFQFLDLLHNRYQPVARPLPAHRAAQTKNKLTYISILGVGFEPTISVFERTKTVHALDRAATVIGYKIIYKKGKCSCREAGK
jgi:hypothetical protein